MQSLKQDTLAFQLGCRPSTMALSMALADLPIVVGRVNALYKNGFGAYVTDPVDSTKGSPERDAIIFYLLNHAVSLVRQKVDPYEPLGQYLPLVKEYQRQLSQRASRMFAYMLLICTRESRHSKSSLSGPEFKALASKYGQQVISANSMIRGNGSLEAAAIFMKDPPKMKLGPYVQYLSDVFYTTSFNSSYGGKKWGAVADVLRDYVLGKLTAEMMVDTSFTLAHNTGPIFNKGMLFEHQNNSELQKILDVQRSGQIPQLVCSTQYALNGDDQIEKLHKLVVGILGDSMTGDVDWQKVEDLGAVGSYSQYKPKKAVPTSSPLSGASKSATATAVKKNMVQIMPNYEVEKVSVR